MMAETQNQPDDFVLTGIERCPLCDGKNMSWCIVCFWCGHNFIDADSAPLPGRKAGTA